MSKKCLLLKLGVLNEHYTRRFNLRQPVFEGRCLNLINNTRNQTKMVLDVPVVSPK